MVVVTDARVRLAAWWKPAVLAAFAAYLLVLGAHHEAWFDEAQAWLVARDSTLWQLFAERVRYEGSPGLWHLVLWSAMRLGLPFAQMHLVSTFFAILGAAILLWRAPFPAWLRVLLVCSYFFAFQFAIVARSYALDLLLLPALAALHHRRAAQPVAYGALIGLLANCNAHSFLVAALLGLEFAFHLWRAKALADRRALIGLALAAGLGLFALATTWQPADNDFLPETAWYAPSVAAIHYLRDAFVDRLLPWGPGAPASADAQRGAMLSVLLLIPSLLLFRRAGTWPLAAGFFAALLAFSAFKYASPWHSGVLFLAWLLCVWISWPTLLASAPGFRRLVIGSIALIAGVQALQTFRSAAMEIRLPFSSGPAAARGLAAWQAAHPGATVAALGYKAFSVQPWFARNVFANYHDGAPDPAFIRWTIGEPWKPTEQPQDWAAMIAHRTDALLVSTSDIRRSELPLYLRDAQARGYCIAAVYPGRMIWRGKRQGNDTLLLFTRGDCQG